MAYQTILYEVSDNGVTIAHNRADRLNAFTLGMGRELVEALDPLLVDEFVGHCPAAGDAPQSKVTCVTGSSP